MKTIKLGLDLTKHYEDVSRIVRAKFPVWGSDADDLVQDVCKKIVKLNTSAPYDSSKSSISHYIYLVASGVFSSGLRKDKRSPLKNALSFEHQIAVPSSKEWVSPPNEEGGYVSDFVDYVERNLDDEDVIPKRLLMLTSMGYTKTEIAEILNVSFYRVDKERKKLKDTASLWASGHNN